MSRLFSLRDEKQIRASIRTLVSIRESASEGAYNDDDLKRLSECLRSLITFGLFERDELADLAGVSISTLRAVERGKTYPRYYNFMRILGAALDIASRRKGSGDQRLPAIPSVLEQAAGRSWTADWIELATIEGSKIAVLRTALSDLIDDLRRSNSVGGNSSTIDEFTRKELITILETALNMLKGPMVERGFLQRTASWMKKLGARTVERETVGYLGKKVGEAAAALEAFLRGLL